MRSGVGPWIAIYGDKCDILAKNCFLSPDPDSRMKSFTGIYSFLLAGLETSTGIVRLFLCIALVVLLPSCGDSARTCIDRAVLNCNMIHDFAGKGMERQLEAPSVKLTDAKTGASAPMTRKEVVDDKIAFLEQSLANVRQLRQTDRLTAAGKAYAARHQIPVQWDVRTAPSE
jgi:hypothetical protein